VPCTVASRSVMRLWGNRSTIDQHFGMYDLETSPNNESILDLPPNQDRGAARPQQCAMRRRITILFDLNGVLIRAKSERERQRASLQPYEARPGLEHLLSLRPHFRLGLFTSATTATANKRLRDIDATLWSDPIRCVCPTAAPTLNPKAVCHS
jgi:hypothetical protein